MLKQIQIDNFRCFEDFSANLKPITLLVGPNKSGKTTILSAIRFALFLFELAIKENESFIINNNKKK